MTGKNNHDHETENKNTGFIVGFFIVAIVSIAVCVFCRHLIDDGSSEKEVKNKQDRPVTTTVSEVAEVTEVPETTAVVTTTAKPQNLKYVYVDSGKELPALNIILDKTSNKTYKVNLNKLANENDIITAFRFIFYAEDGVSNLGELKGGYGVNVDPLSPLATDDGWYQSEDFSVYSDGAYCEVVCEVPLELALSIDIKGKLMVGYWWSDQQTVRLERIICEKYAHIERPIDDSKSFEVNIPLNFNNAETQKYLLPLREIVPEGTIPEFVSFTIESTNGEPIGKFSGQIGISTKASLYDGFYKEKDMVVYSDTNTHDVTWLVPDEVKKLLDYDGNIELSFWWGDCEEIKITKVNVQYSEK
ncbi:MAG: hypothetical protein E7510_10820 [Ruminococcus sp.]|nr:hypothetical protein [Ruminococcus sp.]